MSSIEKYTAGKHSGSVRDCLAAVHTEAAAGLYQARLDEATGVRNHDEVKYLVFNQLLTLQKDHQLSLAELFQKIGDLTAQQRRLLFYKGSSSGASKNSGAAKLFKQLCGERGLWLTDSDMQYVVSDGCLPGRTQPMDRLLSSLSYAPDNQLLINAIRYELLKRAVQAPDVRAVMGAFLERAGRVSPDDNVHKPYYISQCYALVKAACYAYGGSEAWLNVQQMMHDDVADKYKPFAYIVGTEDDYVQYVKDLHDVALKQDPVREAVATGVASADMFPGGGVRSAVARAAGGGAGQAHRSRVRRAAPTDRTKIIRSRHTSRQEQDKRQAVSAIETYMGAHTAGSVKCEFARTLRRNIRNEGLSVATLNAVMRHVWVAGNRNAIFKKLLGNNEKSRGALLVYTCYELALGRKLLKREKVAIVRGRGELPRDVAMMTIDAVRYERLRAMDKQRQEAEDAQRLLERSPVAAKLSVHTSRRMAAAHASQGTEDEYKDDDTASTVSADSTVVSAAGVAIGAFAPSSPVREEGELEVGADIPMCFDTNGHALQLHDHYYSIDILGPGVQLANATAFKTWVEGAIAEKTRNSRGRPVDLIANPAQLRSAIDVFMGHTERGSVIGLQQEIDLHMRLIARTIEKKLRANLGGDLNLPMQTAILNACQQAANAMNTVLVRNAFAAALEKAYVNGELNIERLNHELAKAREGLLAPCEQEIIGQLHVEFSKIHENAKFEEVIDSLDAHDFHKVTALPEACDYIYTDNQTGLCTRIEGTEETAHHKRFDDSHEAEYGDNESNQAVCEIQRFGFQFKGGKIEVVPLLASNVVARVPSLAALKSGNDEAVIADVVKKLQFDRNKLSDADGGSVCPMNYYLLTSLHTAFWDKTADHKNRQRRSAKCILAASHRVNKQLLAGDPNTDHFVFVQNVPVNQHTNSLDLYAFDDPTGEATLMAELAMLSTLYQRADDLPAEQAEEVRELYRVAKGLYVDFLTNDCADAGVSYFHKSKQGKQLRDMLAVRNAKACQFAEIFGDGAMPSDQKESVQSLVTRVLFKLQRTGTYRNKQYGMLVQALSAFIHPKGLLGCKSANERFQAVASRLEMLQGIAYAEQRGARLSQYQSMVKECLAMLCNASSDPVMMEYCLGRLQRAVDQCYNAHTVAASAAFVSQRDQGGAAKVKASKSKTGSLLWKEVSTNIAEVGYVDRLKAQNAKSYQAHSGDMAARCLSAYNRVAGRRPARPCRHQVPVAMPVGLRVVTA